MLICGEIQEELRACKLKRKHKKKLFNIVKLKKNIVYNMLHKECI